MCGFSGPTVALAGGLVQSVGTLVSGFMSYGIANQNAAMFERQAQLRLEKAKFDAANAANKYNRTRGQAMANIGTTGFDPASFSDVFADAAMEGALERKAIKWQGEQEAYNLRLQASGAQQQGAAAMLGGIFGATGQGLGAFGKYAAAQPGPGTGDVGYTPWSYSVTPSYSG